MNDTPETTGREVETTGKIRMTDIVIDGGGVNFANLGQAKAYALAMADGDVAVPKYLRGNLGACLAIIDDAVRFGMSPWALARESYSVKDQIAYQAKLIHAVVLKKLPLKKRPQFVYSGEGKDLQLKVIFTLEDGDVVEHESPKVGEITTKNSPLWQTDVRQQLGYYTVRAAARLQFPEIMLGLYTPEEREALTIDVTPKTSGVAKRLTAGEGSGHAEVAKTALQASRAAQDAPEGSYGSQVPAEEKNEPTPTLRPTQASSGGEEASSTGDTQEPAQPEAGEGGNGFTLTQEERDWLYSVTEDLAQVTNDKELAVVEDLYRNLPVDLTQAACDIAAARIAKKREAIAAKKKRK